MARRDLPPQIELKPTIRGDYHGPYGPPWGAWMQWGVGVEAGEVRRPRGR